MRGSDRRKVLRDHVLQDTQQNDKPVLDHKFISALLEQRYREFQYIAIEYLYMMKDFLRTSDLNTITEIATFKPDRDTIDALVKLMGDLAQQMPEALQLLVNWSRSDNPWLIRLAITHQNHLFAQTDNYVLAAMIDHNQNNSNPIVQNAIYSALRQYAKTNASWVKSLILGNPRLYKLMKAISEE